MAPFAPHFAEEMRSVLGHQTRLKFASWPGFDSELAREEEIEVVVQVNGKVRAKIVTAPGFPRMRWRDSLSETSGSKASLPAGR